eukprot:Phypoly_transcript_21568.p1 GENE.Phypoly_transcript_21568~~Phypoly_transcript_21568.p1  ORF type:complete len:137 (-),score=27.03 Phypoly_transcript_21568:4-414(-)
MFTVTFPTKKGIGEVEGGRGRDRRRGEKKNKWKIKSSSTRNKEWSNAFFSTQTSSKQVASKCRRKKEEGEEVNERGATVARRCGEIIDQMDSSFAFVKLEQNSNGKNRKTRPMVGLKFLFFRLGQRMTQTCPRHEK